MKLVSLFLSLVLTSAAHAQSAPAFGIGSENRSALGNGSGEKDEPRPDQVTVLQVFFNPRDTANHLCRQVPSGGPSSVDVYMCVVLRGGVISMPGDVVAVAMNRTGQDLEVMINCMSTYVPAMQFTPTSMPGWGNMGLHLTRGRPNDFIGIGSVGRVDRLNWFEYGKSECKWSAKVEPRKDDVSATERRASVTGSQATAPQPPSAAKRPTSDYVLPLDAVITN